MARFSRLKVASVMEEIGFIPIFYQTDIDVCKKILTACYNGGARVAEFTNRGDYAHEVFGELNKFAEENLPEMILGAGSLTDSGTTSLYLQLGANFIVTPVLRKDIAIVCNRRKVLWSPGCGSLSEIAEAEELGAEIVKLFPGSQLGPGFVKAIKGPCPWTSIMPTGGVSTEEENLRGWFDAGVTCVGIGSRLITRTYIENEDFKGLEKQVQKTLQLIQTIRNK